MPVSGQLLPWGLVSERVIYKEIVLLTNHQVYELDQGLATKK